MTKQQRGKFITAARRMYATDDVEIDDYPKVSEGSDGGCFVAAWVWVSDEDAGE